MPTNLASISSTNQDYINQLYNGLGGYSYTSLTNFAKDFSENTDEREKLQQFHPGIWESDPEFPDDGYRFLCPGCLEELAAS